MKEKFIELLRSTGRQGIDEVISYLEKAGFFTAPASSVHHLNVEGGLLKHSMNVYNLAMAMRGPIVAMRPDMESRLPVKSIIIAALLHDVCKTDVYKKSKRWSLGANGRWGMADRYAVDYSHMPVRHGEKSVIMLLSLGLKLSVDEIIAIRWHMGPWDLSFQSREALGNLNSASTQCPLLSLIHAADGMAAHILEV